MLAILRRPSSMLTVSNVFALALGVFSAAIQARILGPEGRGELATAVVPGTVLSMLLCLGLPDYFARRAARNGNGGQAAKLALVLSTAIGCIAIWPYILLVQFLAPPETNAWWLLALYACSTPLFIFGYCLVAICMGLSNWYFVAVSKILPQTLTIVGLIVMSFFSANALTVGTLLIVSNILGLLLPLLGKAIRPRGQVHLGNVREAVSFGLRGWTKTSEVECCRNVAMISANRFSSIEGPNSPPKQSQSGFAALSLSSDSWDDPITATLSLPSLKCH